jgi:Tol biopolymer transport system component
MTVTTSSCWTAAPAFYERVSVDSTGVEGNNDSLGPAMTPDGRFVAFTSDADNLVAGDGNFDVDVFVQDRAAHTTVRVSVRTDGTETGFELGSSGASISANGQVVAFDSEGALVPQDTGFPVDVFVHDEQQNRLVLVLEVHGDLRPVLLPQQPASAIRAEPPDR